MSRYSNESDKKAMALRRIAEDRLKAGTAPRAGGVPLNKDALTLLYNISSDPERSSEALKLLHELQVHQVELDLQREQLEINESEMKRELALYKALFELTPTICLVATSEGRITEANPAAASLLNTGHDELLGRTMHDFLKQESYACWSEMLHTLEDGEPAASCEVLVAADGKQTNALALSGAFLSEGEVLLFGIPSRKPGFNDFSQH